jgi:hypothetical protein
MLVGVQQNLRDKMNKFSPSDASAEGLAAKMTVAILGWLGGITLTEVLTLASLIYMMLNIYVLVRDKIVRAHRKEKLDRSTESSYLYKE